MDEYNKAIERIDPKTIVYVDEMGIDTFIHRQYAYAKRGRKVIERKSGKKYKRTSIVAGKVNGKIIAPMQYQGSMESKLFEYRFEYCLIPLPATGSTVVIDNASFHNKKRLDSLTEKYGYKVIFLPPYSPELNETEKFWGWLKGKLKKVVHEFQDFNEALRYCFNII